MIIKHVKIAYNTVAKIMQVRVNGFWFFSDIFNYVNTKCRNMFFLLQTAYWPRGAMVFRPIIWADCIKVVSVGIICTTVLSWPTIFSRASIYLRLMR